MNCPRCRTKMIVGESKSTGYETVRRYKCPECGHTIHTEEKATKAAKNKISVIHRKYVHKLVDTDN